MMKLENASDPLLEAAGAVQGAAVYLGVSVMALLGALVASFWEVLFLDLFLVWLSGALFTLGILKYWRSQLPPGAERGPDL